MKISVLKNSVVIPCITLLYLSSSVGQGQVPLQLDPQRVNDLEVTLAGKVYNIQTTGGDPFVYTQGLTRPRPRDARILSFEYFSPKGLDHLQVFFGDPTSEKRSQSAGRVGAAEGWVPYAFDLSESIADWGQAGDVLRLDLGRRPRVDIQIRNLELRPATVRELEIAATQAAKKQQEAVFEAHLQDYLGTSFASRISDVSVETDCIVIKGEVVTTDRVLLCEIAPYQDVTEDRDFETVLPVNASSFRITVERFVERQGIRYDRALSKWGLFRKAEPGFEILSHARYPDRFTAAYDLPKEVPTSRKGLGGFSTRRGHVEDLNDLDVTSATVNVWFTRFMFTEPGPDRIEHVYGGKAFYFRQKDVLELDSTFRTCARHGIVTAAILLVSKAEACSDPEIGRLTQHPDMDPSGIYSMPNMTTPESVRCYAAALDFLASRYSRPDKRYGRCHHWIMHNEVDAGWVWTNMGDKTAPVFMDAYHKSMRLCYAIARSYNPHAEVFVTLTHYWAWTSRREFYPSKDLMDILLDYTHAEGDFQWAMAHHPYPESLFEPKTWLDQKVSFDFNTPLITFKYLEVLDAWIKQPRVLYQGKYKRTLWLSENGTNSRSYSEQDLKEQAAGFAYAWKKMKGLDGIDGFQWHNWFDNRGEGGLRIGLRRFPDDTNDPGGIKPVWRVYQAADTDREDAVFDPYKEVIGIESWDAIRHVGPIDPAQRKAALRDIQSDTWVASDALGRALPGYGECGPRKTDRFVGMFYFMTHVRSGGKGPFDVTKIKQANPEHPQWGDGSHFWGEPEIGYYLNTDRWAIAKHARELSDAGVDTLIFDVTNNQTYPEVYGAVCEVFRELRALGERTPDICFLASEISVQKLWEEVYRKGLYPDLWFQWQGKPLFLYGQHETPARHKVNDIVFSEEIQAFFSLRQSWAWTSLPWYDNGHDEWPWVDHYPQAIGWHESPDQAEMVPVAVGQHPLSNIGRSFHLFHQPQTDKYDLTPYTDQGLHFQEQWNRTLAVDPQFVFVTGWNEWSAGKKVMSQDMDKELRSWCFYPGAHLGRAGAELKPGDSYFIDQYNQEYSRDIEPMQGGHTDNYYYQLMANVRRYKGVAEPVNAGSPCTIDIQGSFDQWDAVSTTYFDHLGDTRHRQSPGVGQAGPYINTTGRNDIVETKVAHDREHYYVYVKARDPLTPSTDPHWMLLFIDTDQDKTSGWEGYDYLVNAEIRSSDTTTLKAYRDGEWEQAHALAYRVSGNELMIQISRSFLNNTTAFDFHWADNIQRLHDISEFFVNGDQAPERRANYRYYEK